MVLRLPNSWSNWNLEMLVFEERGKPEYPEKNLSEQRGEPGTNSTHIWHRRQDLNPGHIDGRRVLSPLRHPLLPKSSVQVFIPKNKWEWKGKKKVIRWSLRASCWRESISLNIYWVFTIKRRYVLEQKKKNKHHRVRSFCKSRKK